MNTLQRTRQRRRSGQLGFTSGGTTFNNPYNPSVGGTYGSLPPSLQSPTLNIPAGIFTTPVYNPGSPNVVPVGSPQPVSNTMQVFNTTASLVSQILQGWAKNPTNQVAVGGVGVIPNPGVLATQAQAQAQAAAAQQYNPATGQRYSSNSPGGALGSGLDGIINWATNNPIPVFLIIGGIVLFMRDPKKR